MGLECLSGYATPSETLRSVPDGTDRALEFVVLERSLDWSRGRVARHLGLPNHQVRRWRMRGEALLEGVEPSADSREPPPWAIRAMRAFVALARCAPNALYALDTRAAFAEVLDGLESPARFAGDRRPGEYGDVRDGSDDV